MSEKPFGQNLNASAMKFHGCATVIYAPHFEKATSFLLYWYYFSLCLLVKRLLQSRGGCSTRTHIYKTREKNMLENFSSYIYLNSLIQFHRVLPLCLGSPSEKIFNVSAMKFHASATVIYSAHFVKVSAFLFCLFYFIFRILVKRLLQSRDGALQERISINLEKNLLESFSFYIYLVFLDFASIVFCKAARVVYRNTYL